MKPIEFEEVNRVLAKDQPQYQPLPVYKEEGTEGNMIHCWELSPEEIIEVTKTGKIWVGQFTFNCPLQPILLSVNKDDVFLDRDKNVVNLDK